jgi:hypothetical protein
MVVATLGILCSAGCGAKPQAAEKRRLTGKPDLSSAWQSTPLPSRAQSTPVKEGPAPLVYLVEAGAVIRVHDMNAKRDLTRSFVPARSIVRVDARNGVIYGDETVLPGPLAADHRYVIFVDPTGENVARQGVVQPRARGAR